MDHRELRTDTQQIALLPRIALAALALQLAGCSFCQFAQLTAAGHEFNDGYPTATGAIPNGADRSSVRFNNLSVQLAHAPAFVVTFPDGYRAHSRDIDAAMIEQHVGPAVQDRRDGMVRSSYLRRTDQGYFSIGADYVQGKPTSLYFRASNYSVRGLFSTADGSRPIDFPLTEADFGTLFGVTPRVSWERVGTAYGTCRD